MDNVGKIIVIENYKDINIHYSDIHLKSLLNDFISVIDDICNSFHVDYYYHSNIYPLCFITLEDVKYLPSEIQNKIQKLALIDDNIYKYINKSITNFEWYSNYFYCIKNVESDHIDLFLDIEIYIAFKKKYYSQQCINIILELVKRKYNINGNNISPFSLIHTITGEETW